MRRIVVVGGSIAALTAAQISGELPLNGAPEVLAGSVADRSAVLRWQRDGGGATAVAVNHRLPIVKLKRLGAGPADSAPASAHI